MCLFKMLSCIRLARLCYKKESGAILRKFVFGLKIYLEIFFLFFPQKSVRAMYDYAGADNDEVSFKDGDVIVNVQSIDEGWMYGTVQRTGKTGMLPANYVEAI